MNTSISKNKPEKNFMILVFLLKQLRFDVFDKITLSEDPALKGLSVTLIFA